MLTTTACVTKKKTVITKNQAVWQFERMGIKNVDSKILKLFFNIHVDCKRVIWLSPLFVFKALETLVTDRRFAYYYKSYYESKRKGKLEFAEANLNEIKELMKNLKTIS